MQFPDEDDENWDRVISVNINGTFYMTRAVWPHMVRVPYQRLLV